MSSTLINELYETVLKCKNKEDLETVSRKIENKQKKLSDQQYQILQNLIICKGNEIVIVEILETMALIKIPGRSDQIH